MSVAINASAKVRLCSSKPSLHTNISCTPIVVAVVSRHVVRRLEEVVNEGEKAVVSDKPLAEEESKDEKKENVTLERYQRCSYGTREASPQDQDAQAAGKRFLLEPFPEMDIKAFFATFIWKIPASKVKGIELLPKVDLGRKELSFYVRHFTDGVSMERSWATFDEIHVGSWW
ncbi:hypothetical protein L1987_59654 [Smallanthus sonchifolius]|uniref:Uncharacterized protein n=1 Tax=Smallanthus sonchifolius TaxID=185202 RepID=A0ACB9D621_9ASTR|nr:hypothetical protein L1987_59654 [Smallanthus sonchifolius]